MSHKGWAGPLERAGEARWRIPKDYKKEMNTDAIIFATESMIAQIKSDQSPEQAANVACMPGIVGPSMAMPDIHYGYGFPIGGVAAFDVDKGVVSPGGVGYDINCGVRLLRTDLTREKVEPRVKDLVNQLFRDVPSGVGSEGKIRVGKQEMNQVLVKGAKWAVSKGFGTPEDLEHTESHGALPGADPDKVSERAMKRGGPQLGTLGSGNHFLEIQVVDQVYDERLARALGIEGPGQITVMIHTGSRGLGYQVCDDYLVVMREALKKYGIQLPDPQLACAPIGSGEASDYIAAMACAANYAWANRQCIVHWVREAFEQTFQASAASLGLRQIYDVAHNIAKFEEHEFGGQKRKLCIHRKGATRAYGPGHPEIPAEYREVGQPVIVPGDMGSASYLLVGTEGAMRDTFGSTCHGAGRLLSRHAAIRAAAGRNLMQEMAERGVYVRSATRDGLAEEMPGAYKDVDEVVDACQRAGISTRVARLRPLGVMKG
jgi:tRNA-splicing ligase RtcB